MLITKKNRIAVYSYLFKEGTIVVKKDTYAEKHSDALPMPNLEVMKLLQSLTSKGLVTQVYNWRWFYYYLTEKGITYLRQYLGIPEDIVPATLRVTASSTVARPPRDQGEKKAGPGGDFNPQFRGSREGREGREGGAGKEGGYRREGGFGRSAAPPKV